MKKIKYRNIPFFAADGGVMFLWRTEIEHQAGTE